MKFLKSPRSEAAFIGDYVVRLILANTDTAIKFINNGKTVYHSTGDGSLENALFCVYGNAISNSLYPVEFDNGYIRVGGYVGSESIAGKNRAKQSIFVNRRYIKSSLISNAAQRAFDTRLMNGRFPFFVLDITISSREIDVNVHPNKLSVRFRDDERVALSVTRAITEALNSVSTAYPFLNVPLNKSRVLSETPIQMQTVPPLMLFQQRVNPTQEPIDMTTSMIMRNQQRMYSRTNQLSFERKL